MKYKILSLCSAGWIGLTPAISFSAPQGGQVTAGDAAISQSGTLTTINQNSQNATIHWDSFNISEHETVNFIQPDTSSVALNQIGGSDPSVIMGNLNANGQVYLSNPNGVIFSSSSQVNVGSLIATSSNINFNQDNSVDLSGNNGSVINNGEIVAADSGFIAFFAPEIINNGELTTAAGDITLTTQNSGTLYLPETGSVGFELDSLQSVNAVAIENTGILSASRGRVILTSDAVDNTLKQAVNNEGIISVSAIEENGGQIRITANQGSVSQTGELTADAGINGNGGDIILIADQYMYASGSLSSRGGRHSGNGGFIETSGYADIDFDAQVDTTAAHGEWGHWLIDPATVVIDAAEAANIESNLNSGNVTVQADDNIDVDSAISGSNTGGSLTLESQQININENISANGVNLNASDIALAANISSAGEIDIQANSNLSVDGNRSLTVSSNSALSMRGATVTGTNGNGDSLTLNSETGELSLQSLNVENSLDALTLIRNNSSASLAEINLSGTISSDNFSFVNNHSSEQLFVLSGDLSINSNNNVSFGDSRLTGDNSGFSLTAGSATLDTIDGIASITINNSGETRLSGNLSTKGSGIEISGSGNLFLNNSVTLLAANTGDMIINSDITSSATNNEDLNIQVADGELNLADVSGINNLSILNSSDLTTLNGDIDIAGTINTNNTRIINLSTDVANFTSSGFNSSNTRLRSDGALNIINTGNQVSLGEIETQSLSVSSSRLELNGDLTTSSAVTNSLDLSDSGEILIAADTQIEGKLNLATGTSIVAIDNVSGNDKYSLDIDVGTQDLSLGEIGANNSLQSFSLTGTGSLTLNSTTPIPLTSGSAGVSFLGNWILNMTAADTFSADTSANNGTINLSGLKIDAASVSLNAGSGDISLGELGGTTALTALSVNTNGTINLHGNINTAELAIDFSNATAILLQNDITLGSELAPLTNINLGTATVDGNFDLSLNTTALSMGEVGQDIALQNFDLNLGENDLTINNDVNVAGNLSVDANLLTLDAEVSSSGGDIVLNAAAGVSMSRVTNILAADGNITVTAATGDVSLATLSALNQVSVTSTTGNISNAIDDYESNNNTSINIAAADIRLSSGLNTGLSSDSPIVLSAGESGSITLTTQGDSFIANINNSEVIGSNNLLDNTLASNIALTDAAHQFNYDKIGQASNGSAEIENPTWGEHHSDKQNNETVSAPKIYYSKKGWRLGNPGQ